MNSYLIPLHNTKVRCCKCYQSYWKKVKESKNSLIDFDDSIEKVFSYRKYFGDAQTLNHFCKNCLSDGMYRIPYEIVKFEAKVRGKMNCIWKFKSGEIPMTKCCCGCINFIVCNYGSCFLIEI